MNVEQEAKPPVKKQKWKTLESNPEVINEFMYGLGVSKDYKWSDCLGLEPETLAFTSLPCYALMFLYPIGSISKDTQVSESEESTPKVSEKVYFVKQLVANACGTIAVVHAIANNRDKIVLDKERGLQKFIDNTIDKTPKERGELLGYDDMIAQSHESSAKKGQTKPEDVAPSDFHFVCFTEVDGNLYQLDGGKPAPINRGKTSPETFLQDAARVVKEQFIQKSGKELFFSILTLGLSSGEESFELPTKIQKTNEVSDEAIASITSMGFSEEQARNSLMISGNNVEQAINYLLSSM